MGVFYIDIKFMTILTKEKRIMSKAIKTINSKMRKQNKVYAKAITNNKKNYEKVAEEFAELNAKDKDKSFADLKILLVLSIIMTIYFISKNLLM